MFFRNKSGRIIAQVRLGEGTDMTPETRGTSNAEVFRTLRFIPRNFLKVDVQYYGIGDETFKPLNEPRRRTMDIQSALADIEEKEQADKPAPNQDAVMLFVGPASDKSPDDGILVYSTIEAVFDIAKVPERSVVLFRPDQAGLLKCLCENETLFGLELRVLTGLPEVDYSPDFDNATWALEKVAYLPFLSELRLAAELDDQLKAQNSTVYDREKATYTRKTGSVKEHTNFEVMKAHPVPAEGGDDEDLS